MTDTASGSASQPAATARIGQSYEMMFPRSIDTSAHARSDEDAHDVTPTIDEGSELPLPQWSGRRAFLLGWLLPSTTAQRTQMLTLRRAWLVHLTAALLAPIVIVLLTICGDIRGPIGQTAIVDGFGDLLTEIADDFRRHPYETTFLTLGTIALIEVGHVVIALLMSAWGARDELLRNSLRNAVRQVWLRTPHVIAVAIMVGSVAIPLSRMDRDWNDAYSVPEPVWPQPPLNVQRGTPAWNAYSATLTSYWQEHSEWRARRNSAKPLYLAVSPLLIVFTVISGIIWFLWAMLRSIGARRRVVAIARAHTCESCGYNLMTIPSDSRCPECARSVLASIGPDARPGPVWGQRRDVGRISAWVRCVVDPIVRPTEFGMRCRLEPQRADHRWFLFLHLPPIFLTAVVAFLSMFVLTVDAQTYRQAIMNVIPASPIPGIVCCMGALGVTLAGGTIVGLYHSIREKRNLLPGATQVACYLAGFLMIWASCGARLIMAVAVLQVDGAYASLQERWGINPNMAIQFSIIAPNTVVGIWYLTLLSRGTAATRYANK